MTNGYVVVARSRETKGIYVEATDDWTDYADMRLIYCQAVGSVEEVNEKIERWLEENEGLQHRQDDVNDVIAEMVASVQWIANEHPVRSFRHVALVGDEEA